MIYEIKVVHKGAVPGSANLTPQLWEQILKGAGEAVGRYWLENFLDKHFTKAGGREYGYRPRKNQRLRPGSKSFRRHAGPAEKAAGEILPLVHGGSLRTSAPIGARVEVTESVIRVKLPGARGMNRLPAGMRKDLTRVSPAEGRKLAQVYDSWIGRRLRRIQRQTTQRF